jgi:hypothetical protein
MTSAPRQRQQEWAWAWKTFLVLHSLLVAGCDDGKPKEQQTLKEVIDVQGTCWEVHVGQRDSYAGQIVRWQVDGKILTYGFVSIPFSAERAIDEATHPTVYHTPPMVSFEEIEMDTDQPRWVLKGVSDRGENSQGYDAMCELEVVKRGTKLPGLYEDHRD